MTIKISDLKNHPYNITVFRNVEGDEFENLKQDIKERGIQIPIEITKDNILLCGHQRVRALKELGITELKTSEYKIRYDLDTDYKQKMHLISDNILRRQLDDVEKVRVGEAMEGIEREEAKKRFGGHHKDNSTVEKLPQLKLLPPILGEAV